MESGVAQAARHRQTGRHSTAAGTCTFVLWCSPTELGVHRLADTTKQFGTGREMQASEGQLGAAVSPSAKSETAHDPTC